MILPRDSAYLNPALALGRTVIRVWYVCQAWRIVAAMTSRSSLTPDDDVTATVTSSSPAAAAAAGVSSAAAAAERGAGGSLLKTAPPSGPAAARQQPAAAAAEAVNPLSIGYVTAALVLGLLCLVLGVVYGFIHFTRVNPRFRLARLVHDQGTRVGDKKFTKCLTIYRKTS